jgi:myxalamid-type nonribosomal peptide synthetase MxaA
MNEQLLEQPLRPGSSASAIARFPRDQRLPLSFAQERLWFLDQLGVVGAAYNLQTALKLQGHLNVDALECSLSELARRHESLRTRFAATEGTPTQVIDPPRRCVLKERDLTGIAAGEKRAELLAATRREAQCAFDLERGPLWSACLVRIEEHEHVLLLTMHHIVTDGWSWEILHKELAELYGAFVQGRESPLIELPIQYVDYAAWQRQLLQGEALQHHLSYWRTQLSGAPAQLQLPTDRPRQSLPSFRGARFGFELLPALSRALNQLAKRQRVTPFMLFLAAYQVLLSRYCGQDDIVVGSPIAGRTHAQTDGLIGFFVNTLALRTSLTGNPSFRDVLDRVKGIALDAYAHQDLPFEKLVMELRPERHLTRQSIFQVVLSMQNHPQYKWQLPGLTWTRIDNEHMTAPFDLTLKVAEVAGKMSAALVYATDLFDGPTVERMAGHFRRILEGIATDPTCAVQRLPMLTAAERKQVVHVFNDTAAPYPHDRLIHEVFEERVCSSPDSVAVICDGRAVTYAELNIKSNQLAHFLCEQGVQTGERVPLVMERCLQMLVAQLAVLKSGGVYVPVDSSLPVERQLFMVTDCGACRVLATKPKHVAFDPIGVQWLDCAALAAAFERLPRTNLGRHIQSSSPAYVMYTSGSTGTPKGVVVPHRAVNRLVINNRYACIEPSDCVAHCSNPMFDASTFEIWGPLLNGARVLVVPPCVVLEVERFVEVLIQQRVTVLWLTIGLFGQYHEALAPVFKRLRYLFTGGDIVEPGVLRRVLRNSPPRHLVHAYGPTECTTFSTTYLVENIEEDKQSVPIGRPIGNGQIYIVDSWLQPVPIGVVGEMYIGGDGVALGYLDRPELTEQRFLANPFGNGLVYKSGDLARWRDDGNIEFIGRNDQQVKLRGFRVELGEVEAALARHSDVNEVVVIAREDVPAQKYLVAYVTPQESRLPSVDQLRAHLARTMPDYMIPSAFVVLERLPLTSNGKVDKRLLPLPRPEAYGRQQYEPPEGEVEHTLAGIWQGLLGIERVGREDNFFDLGGHSLLVIKAVFQINQSCDCALTARDMYGSPTVRELAARISSGSPRDDFVDLHKEAFLDDAIRSYGYHRHPARAVLVTGGTGFVGRFLISELLRSSDTTAYCLIRASSTYGASSHLKAALVKWGLWRDEFEGRIVAVPGDMSAPGLGIEEHDYRFLSATVDAIYHCATSMNHLETYAMARRANVESARELLKFAVRERAKALHYVSTLSVFSSTRVRTDPLVDETSSIDYEQHSTAEGYVASKWVAERIFMTAAARGIPCNIFRLGLVWADTQHGRYDELQREYRLLKSCLVSGYGIVDYRYEMAPLPVDYVARAIVSLASHRQGGHGIYHICSSGEPLDHVFERCNDIAGTSLELVPHYDWICEIKRLHQQGRSLPIVPLVQFAFDMDEGAFYERRQVRSARVQFDCSRTQHELRHLGIEPPAWRDELLQKCLASMLLRDRDLHDLTRSGGSVAARG